MIRLAGSRKEVKWNSLCMARLPCGIFSSPPFACRPFSYFYWKEYTVLTSLILMSMLKETTYMAERPTTNEPSPHIAIWNIALTAFYSIGVENII